MNRAELPQLIRIQYNHCCRQTDYVFVQFQQISYISMAPKQLNPVLSKPTIMPVPSAKPTSAIISTASLPRTTTLNTMQKREPIGMTLLSTQFNRSGYFVETMYLLWISISDYQPEIIQPQPDPRIASPISRRDSSDGSTTVSVPSSPGADNMEQEDLNAFYHVRLAQALRISFTRRSLIHGIFHLILHINDRNKPKSNNKAHSNCNSRCSKRQCHRLILLIKGKIVQTL